MHAATSRSKGSANCIGWVFNRKKNTASWVSREEEVSKLGGAGGEYDENTLSEDLKELTKNSPFMISHSPLHHLYLLENMSWDPQEEFWIAFPSLPSGEWETMRKQDNS